MRRVFSALAALSLSAPAAAVNFNDVLPGARAMGMGSAFAAVADDGNAPFYNPAGTANTPYIQAGGSLGRYLSPVGTLSNMAMTYLRPYEPINTATIGAAYYAGRQTNGGDKDVFLFNYAQEYRVTRVPLSKPLKLGANLKFVNVDRGAQGGKFGLGFDAGVLARTEMGLSLGAALMDLTTDVGVPRGGLTLAGAYAWHRRLLFVGDLRMKGGHSEFYPGVEATFHQGLLRARAGKGVPLDGVGTLALGLGVNFSPIVLDVAMTIPFNGIHRRGGAYMATFNYRFGAPSFAGQFVGQAASQAESLRQEIARLQDQQKTAAQQARTADTERASSEGELRVLERRVAEAQDQYRALLKRNEELDYRSAEKAATMGQGPKPKPLPVARKPAPPAWPKRHEVKPGDTLRSIAARYYGDPNLWEKVYDANAAKVDRGLPVEGAVLTIPSPKP
ncbi:MAG: LysM peptidoglycan-binding domain-containing protein [Elusimicrobiota bacterium]|nr:LysM peptidoglycan-binding domain-containing protein [Elusimicrobiota bacterium]